MASVKVVDNEQLDEELKKIIRAAYDESARDEYFFVGVSGGSLPKMLVRVLKQMENVDWKKWLFFFCDERVVPSASEESTFGTYKRLLEPPDERLPLSLSQFVAINPGLKSKKVAEDYLSKMRQRFDNASNLPRFHLLLLGLGPDGHTCSLFPGHRLLKETKWIAYIEDSPKPPPERITMTLPVINNAKYCVFVATGENKADVIKEILEDKKPYPAGMVQPHSGKLIWLMDKAAGSKLKQQQN
jgi:6-phosphogluconolactonase